MEPCCALQRAGSTIGSDVYVAEPGLPARIFLSLVYWLLTSPYNASDFLSPNTAVHVPRNIRFPLAQR